MLGHIGIYKIKKFPFEIKNYSKIYREIYKKSLIKKKK